MNQTPEKGAEGRAGRGGRGRERRVASCEYHITRADGDAIDESTSRNRARSEASTPTRTIVPRPYPPRARLETSPSPHPRWLGCLGGRSRSPPASPFSPAARGTTLTGAGPLLFANLCFSPSSPSLSARDAHRDRRPPDSDSASTLSSSSSRRWRYCESSCSALIPRALAAARPDAVERRLGEQNLRGRAGAAQDLGRGRPHVLGVPPLRLARLDAAAQGVDFFEVPRLRPDPEVRVHRALHRHRGRHRAERVVAPDDHLPERHRRGLVLVVQERAHPRKGGRTLVGRHPATRARGTRRGPRHHPRARSRKGRSGSIPGRAWGWEWRRGLTRRATRALTRRAAMAGDPFARGFTTARAESRAKRRWC